MRARSLVDLGDRAPKTVSTTAKPSCETELRNESGEQHQVELDDDDDETETRSL